MITTIQTFTLTLQPVGQAPTKREVALATQAVSVKLASADTIQPLSSVLSPYAKPFIPAGITSSATAAPAQLIPAITLSTPNHHYSFLDSEWSAYDYQQHGDLGFYAYFQKFSHTLPSEVYRWFKPISDQITYDAAQNARNAESESSINAEDGTDPLQVEAIETFEVEDPFNLELLLVAAEIVPEVQSTEPASLPPSEPATPLPQTPVQPSTPSSPLLNSKWTVPSVCWEHDEPEDGCLHCDAEAGCGQFSPLPCESESAVQSPPELDSPPSPLSPSTPGSDTDTESLLSLPDLSPAAVFGSREPATDALDNWSYVPGSFSWGAKAAVDDLNEVEIGNDSFSWYDLAMSQPPLPLEAFGSHVHAHLLPPADIKPASAARPVRPVRLFSAPITPSSSPAPAPTPQTATGHFSLAAPPHAPPPKSSPKSKARAIVRKVWRRIQGKAAR